jgi:hypothetical protein
MNLDYQKLQDICLKLMYPECFNDLEGLNICFECGKKAEFTNECGWGFCPTHAMYEVEEDDER